MENLLQEILPGILLLNDVFEGEGYA